jgi:hypothetical protein
MNVDALSHQYQALRKSNDKWNQVIMVISSFGALITSVMTIAELVGWPFEIVPIVIQTMSGVLAAWMRFYDFPKRMEAIINTKHASNDVRERLQKASTMDEALWEQYCSAEKNLYTVLMPEERDRSTKRALKYMKRQRVREAQLHQLLSLSNDELIAGPALSRIGINSSGGGNSDSKGSPPPSPMIRHLADVRLSGSSIPSLLTIDEHHVLMRADEGKRNSSASKRPVAAAQGTEAELKRDRASDSEESDSDTSGAALEKRRTPPRIEKVGADDDHASTPVETTAARESAT